MDGLTGDIALAIASMATGSGLTTLFIRHSRGAHVRGRSRSGSVPSIDPLLHDAAQQWAAMRGRPELAPLLREKLRTLHSIRYRDARPQRKHWWKRW